MYPFSKLSSVIQLVAYNLLLVFCLSQGVLAQMRAQQGAAVQPRPVSNANVSGSQAAAASPVPNPELVIGSGDLLEVSVFGAPDYDRQVRISADGEISLPMVGTVKVGGLTILQTEQLLEKRFADGGYFTDPRVSVFVRDYATQGVSVLGEVQKPGIYPMLGVRKLFDVISAAGGTTPKSGNVISITHRAHPDQPQTLKYDPINSPASNVEVLAGDTVVVSKAGIVYVIGDVRLPSGFVMDKSELTVLQAIAMAQGTNPTAALDQAKLIRTTATGRQEIPIPLKKILQAQRADVKLQAEDIVFVPGSKGKAAGRRTLEAILQAATGIAIYGTRP